MGLRLNIGCRETPTPGWLNFDKSPATWISRWPGLAEFLRAIGLLKAEQAAYVETCRRLGIRYADASRRIPVPDRSVSVLYSSHMIEHLDRQEAASFLQECLRVLEPGGILRLSVPDLYALARTYVEDRDAEKFLYWAGFDVDRPRGARMLLGALVDDRRQHRWMYDGASLAKLLQDKGFVDVTLLPAGKTGIADPGALDLREREAESAYVEARRP